MSKIKISDPPEMVVGSKVRFRHLIKDDTICPRDGEIGTVTAVRPTLILVRFPRKVGGGGEKIFFRDRRNSIYNNTIDNVEMVK